MIAGESFDLAFAEKRLAESRDRMQDYRKLENSFVAGSVDRERASILLEDIEVLHQIMDRLCHQLRLQR
jgi:division protein CdvB (Snf7/Vps24/ESCRT-III family)